MGYEVLYDVEACLGRPGSRPRGPVRIGGDTAAAGRAVRAFLFDQWRQLAREPAGRLRHGFLRPGSIYRGLWDWDAFFVACAIPDEGLSYARGSIENLLDGVREDGRPPKAASPDGMRFDYESHPIPLHAQFVYLMAARLGDFSWVEPHWAALEAVRRWYERETTAPSEADLFVWLGNRGNGIDNHPAVYGRPPRSSAGVDLSCWHARECVAMARLAAALGRGSGAVYAERGARLADGIRTRYWDVIDGLFYAIDCRADPTQASLQGVNWPCFLKFRSWTTFFPLWAGLATPPQAKALCALAMDSREFLSVAGLRSHSARDPIYNNVPMGNPSNWQGPVWGLSTFLTAYGLARHGFRAEALDLAGRQVRTFAADLEANGCLHEFYHGDTGQPLLNPGFLSWDLLALNVLDELGSGRDCTTGDLVP